eukprot:COSAG06_NODE_9166_length_1969_cov_1.624599_1_plen_286_part_00
MCCGVMVQPMPAGCCEASTKATASLVVACSITTLRFGTWASIGSSLSAMNTCSRSKKSTSGSTTSPWMHSTIPCSCATRTGARSGQPLRCVGAVRTRRCRKERADKASVPRARLRAAAAIATYLHRLEGRHELHEVRDAALGVGRRASRVQLACLDDAGGLGRRDVRWRRCIGEVQRHQRVEVRALGQCGDDAFAVGDRHVGGRDGRLQVRHDNRAPRPSSGQRRDRVQHGVVAEVQVHVARLLDRKLLRHCCQRNLQWLGLGTFKSAPSRSAFAGGEPQIEERD